jgi:DNA-binding response OmpR family regulator
VIAKETYRKLGEIPSPRIYENGSSFQNSYTLPEGIVVDFEKEHVIKEGIPIKLFPQEWKVLNLLASNVNNAIPQNELTEAADSVTPEGGRYPRIIINGLRKKLGIGTQGSIKNVRDFGYILDDGRSQEADMIHCPNGIDINLAKRQVTKDNVTLKLTPQEYRMIEILGLSLDEVVSYKDLAMHVLQHEVYSNENLKIVSATLRKKLGINAREGFIRNVYGKGILASTDSGEKVVADFSKKHSG